MATSGAPVPVCRVIERLIMRCTPTMAGGLRPLGDCCLPMPVSRVCRTSYAVLPHSMCVASSGCICASTTDAASCSSTLQVLQSMFGRCSGHAEVPTFAVGPSSNMNMIAVAYALEACLVQRWVFCMHDAKSCMLGLLGAADAAGHFLMHDIQRQREAR